MNISKTLESLKKHHTEYEAEVAALTAKKKQIEQTLAEAEKNMLRTFDAIRALEGEPSFAEIIQKAAPENFHKVDIFEDDTPKDLPPAEKGMRWTKNALGEDVLVPIDTRQLILSNEPVVLPSIGDEEGFDDPTSFI